MEGKVLQASYAILYIMLYKSPVPSAILSFMASTKRQKHSQAIPLDVLIDHAQSIAYMGNQGAEKVAQNSIYDNVAKSGSQGMAGQEGELVGVEGAGGRSEKVLPPPRETAKPLPLISPLSDSLSEQNDPPSIPSSSPTSCLASEISPSDMPVLDVSRGVHRKEGVDVVQVSHTGGIHVRNSPVLSQGEPPVVENVTEVPYAPGVDAPQNTSQGVYKSPFVTGNDRIDRRTAFTQYCRRGEGRSLEEVASIMAVPIALVRQWASEDGWENAYRGRITADILQVAKEDNIHEYLDVKREIIAQLKARISEAKQGKDAFKSTKEMLDTMLRLEELTGAKGMDDKAKPGQIFVVIDREEWEAREKINEKARLDEVAKA
jgi:hypothetical protein